jgi:uncharacterized protein YraI
MFRKNHLLILTAAIMLVGCRAEKNETPVPPTTEMRNNLPTIPSIATATNIQVGMVVPSATNTDEVPTATFTQFPTASATNTDLPPTPTTPPPTPTLTGLVSAGGRGLNMRAEPNGAAAVVASLSEQTSFIILEESADGLWLKVQLADGKVGWVAKDYITVNPVVIATPIPTAVAIADANPLEGEDVPDVEGVEPVDNANQPQGIVTELGDTLRLREQPSMSANVITRLAKGTALRIVGQSTDGGWLKVVTPDGLTGWVATHYVDVKIDLELVAVPPEGVDVAPPPNVLVAAPGVVGPGGSYTAVSGVTSTSAQIFLYGQSIGNRPNVFTRVGDSITATSYFLYPIGYGTYNLQGYSALQPVIGFFQGGTGHGANPFASASFAAHNSWATPSILDPSLADPGSCQAGETPLACEYRTVKPSVALIMIGTNDSGGIPIPQYQANLQTIVQTSINMGVIPILSTIPNRLDVGGAVNTYNQVIISTARAYDVPLMDYWSVMQSLPNTGLGPDGIHPSIPPGSQSEVANFTADNLNYGYTMRNLLALQALDAIWRQVIAVNVGRPPATSPPGVPPPTPFTTTLLACTNSPPTRLSVGQTARVSAGSPNNVRSSPSTSAQRIGQIPGGASFQILEGPICGDGLTFWRVNYNGLIGWTAEGQDREYWLEP